MGQIARGFDSLGYWCSPLGLAIIQKTVDRCAEQVSQLYEHGADVVRIETYLGWGIAGGREEECVSVSDAPFRTHFAYRDACRFLRPVLQK